MNQHSKKVLKKATPVKIENVDSEYRGLLTGSLIYTKLPAELVCGRSTLL